MKWTIKIKIERKRTEECFILSNKKGTEKKKINKNKCRSYTYSGIIKDINRQPGTFSAPFDF